MLAECADCTFNKAVKFKNSLADISITRFVGTVVVVKVELTMIDAGDRVLTYRDLGHDLVVLGWVSLECVFLNQNLQLKKPVINLA